MARRMTKEKRERRKTRRAINTQQVQQHQSLSAHTCGTCRSKIQDGRAESQSVWDEHRTAIKQQQIQSHEDGQCDIEICSFQHHNDPASERMLRIEYFRK